MTRTKAHVRAKIDRNARIALHKTRISYWWEYRNHQATPLRTQARKTIWGSIYDIRELRRILA